VHLRLLPAVGPLLRDLLLMLAQLGHLGQRRSVG
jgi:hypothetical protein